MKKCSTLDINRVLLLALLTSNLLAAEASKPMALKWIFDAPGSFTAAPVVATDGAIYFSTVNIDNTKEKYLLYKIAPGEGGGTAVEKWCYDFGDAAVTTSPALSVDEKVVYVTSNYNYDSKKPAAGTSTAQITALDSITNNSAGKLAEIFHQGYPLSLPKSVVGAPKVVPDTHNIFVNTFDLVLFKNKHKARYIQQNIRIYHPDGDLAFNTRGTGAPGDRSQLSWFTTMLAPAAWLDFEHREPVLNGRGGAAQIVNYGWLKSGLYLADYRHIDTALRDDTRPEEWLLWESAGRDFSSSTDFVPQLALDTNNRLYYFVKGSDLYAYKENEENGKFVGWTIGWTKSITPVGATLAAVAPTIFMQETATDDESVVRYTGTLYLGSTKGHVYGVNPDDFGATVLFNWDISPNALNKRMAIDNINDILYVVDAKGALFALDLRAKTSMKTVLWQINDAAITTAPTVSLDDGSVVVGSSNRLQAYVGGRGNG